MTKEMELIQDLIKSKKIQDEKIEKLIKLSEKYSEL